MGHLVMKIRPEAVELPRPGRSATCDSIAPTRLGGFRTLGLLLISYFPVTCLTFFGISPYCSLTTVPGAERPEAGESMSLHIYIAHTGERFQADPVAFTSYVFYIS